MDERQIIEVVGQVMVYDSTAKQWHPAGSSSGLSTVRLIHCFRDNTFRIHGQKINEDKEVVLNSQITREVKYNRANEAFIQWHDSKAFWGLNFRRGSSDAENFFASVLQVLRVLNQNTSQQQQPNILSPDINNSQLAHQQQQQPSQNSAAIIQRPMLQQQMMQQPQQTLLHQQTQLLNQHQHQPQTQTTQLIQAPNQPHLMQQQQHQQQQQQQQQQMHQHYMHHQQSQVTQPPQQTNHNQVNLYQPQSASQQPQPQLAQQQQQPSQQQLQHQAAPVVAAPVPPPPPPPPAPPMGALGAPRMNGTGLAGNGMQANGSSNPQHPLMTNNANNNYAETNARNGGSPNQVATSLASELAKCQLKKVNLSRSDSDKESECNNNNIPNAKATRAASLAYVPDNLMNDLSKKLASRRERLDQQGDSHSSNNVSNPNGISNDKGQESWLADLIRKEISKEISKMKAEIIDAIRSELRQR